MEPRVPYKDVQLEDRTYRLQKMDPRLACYIFATLGSKSETNILDALGRCTRDEFDELQGYALKFISKVDEKDGIAIPIPILGANGLWGDKTLETDPRGVLNLTSLCLIFNIEPFLGDNKSTAPPSQPTE